MSALADADAAWRHCLEIARYLSEQSEAIDRADVSHRMARAERRPFSEWLSAADMRLGELIRRAPGAFEARLAQRAEELDGGELEELVAEWHYRIRWCLPETFQSLDPVAMLELFARLSRPPSRWRSRAVFSSLVEDVVTHFARRAGREGVLGLDLSPELRDTLYTWTFRAELADILPEDVHRMTPVEIAQALASYVGSPIEDLEERMYPGGLSQSGFLGRGQRLAEVIWTDAQTLHRLGLRRRAIVDRMRLILFSATPTPPWTFERRGSLGYQQNPFHSLEVIEGSANAAFTITNTVTGESVDGGYLVIPLIQRACFFEGDVPYRVDPERAARVLGLC